MPAAAASASRAGSGSSPAAAASCRRTKPRLIAQAASAGTGTWTGASSQRFRSVHAQTIDGKRVCVCHGEGVGAGFERRQGGTGTSRARGGGRMTAGGTRRTGRNPAWRAHSANENAQPGTVGRRFLVVESGRNFDVPLGSLRASAWMPMAAGDCEGPPCLPRTSAPAKKCCCSGGNPRAGVSVDDARQSLCIQLLIPQAEFDHTAYTRNPMAVPS